MNAFRPNGNNPLNLPGNIPILTAKPANVERWRCANGHEFTGGAPRMVLPLNPLQPIGPGALGIVKEAVCLTCVLDFLQAAFPLKHVTEDDETPKE